jgi:hypothetical protein
MDREGVSDAGSALDAELQGQAWVKVAQPTGGGHTDLVLTAGVIDWQAEELLGKHQCHRLAAAVHSRTGWRIVTIDALDDDGGWHPVHSVAVGPGDRAVDIFGDLPLEDMVRERACGRVVRHREVRTEDMPGAVLTDIDDLHGDPDWWAKGAPPVLVQILNTFAKQVVERATSTTRTAGQDREEMGRAMAEQLSADQQLEAIVAGLKERAARLGALHGMNDQIFQEFSAQGWSGLEELQQISELLTQIADKLFLAAELIGRAVEVREVHRNNRMIRSAKKVSLTG